jgi:L-fuconolactonase
VPFVLNHLGKPPLAHGDLATWTRDLRALALSTNTTAKLSGLVTEAKWSSWGALDLQPAVDHALDVFGPDRLMFGSDWPVCLLATDYTQWIDSVSVLLAGLDERSKAAIWRHTACRLYGLERAHH